MSGHGEVTCPEDTNIRGPVTPTRRYWNLFSEEGKERLWELWEQSWGRLSSCLCPTTRQRDLQAPLSEALAGALICQMKEAPEEIASEGCVGWRG